MTKRTSMNLDFDLVAEAGRVLGTARTTETVHAAMREVVAREKRQRLAARGLDGLTPARVERMRRQRVGG
jgi:Arc/MetJ family transcription regulator